MTVVNVEKNIYTVDPVYQWDKNQDLIIYGLSFTTIPEIHFTNDAMDKAIVEQAIMDGAGEAVRVQIDRQMYNIDTLKSCFDIVENANKYNPITSFPNRVIQHSGLIATDSNYTATDFILVPYGYAIMPTAETADGERVQITTDKTSQLIKSICVYELDQQTVIADQGSSSQVAWYANNKTPGDKYVRISFKPALSNKLMLEVVPIVYNETTGVPSDYYTGRTLSGLNTYIPYELTLYLKGENTSPTWYKGKKIATFGDSITQLNTWQPYLEKYFGCEVVNCGVGGSRVADYPVGERSDYMCGDNRINTIPSDVDVILVFGGHNDFSITTPFGEITQWWTLSDENSKSEFYSAYALMLKKLIKKFPNAKIITMSCVGGRTSSDHENEDGQWYLRNYCMEDYAEAVKRISRYYGIPCIDVGGESGINTLNHTSYIADVIHPNNEGGKLIANCVINGMKRFEPIDFD